MHLLSDVLTTRLGIISVFIAVLPLRSMWCCDCIDTSTVSAGDLENIMETETPPQSPAALMSSETQPLMSSTHRRCSIIVGIDTDTDDVLCNTKMYDKRQEAVDETAKSLVSTEQVHSPLSSVPSSPRPSSPVAFSMCPLRLGKTFTFTSMDSEVRSANMAAEALIQRQQEQVGRIAEYNKRGSLISDTQLVVSLSLTVSLLLLS